MTYIPYKNYNDIFEDRFLNNRYIVNESNSLEEEISFYCNLCKYCTNIIMICAINLDNDFFNNGDVIKATINFLKKRGTRVHVVIYDKEIINSTFYKNIISNIKSDNFRCYTHAGEFNNITLTEFIIGDIKHYSFKVNGITILSTNSVGTVDVLYDDFYHMII